MERKVIAELPYMGAFCGSHCAIIKKDSKIYCDCTGGFPQCDMSQWGWGSYAFCPLYGFRFDIQKEKEKLFKYLNYLREYRILKNEIINQIQIELESAQPA